MKYLPFWILLAFALATILVGVSIARHAGGDGIATLDIRLRLLAPWLSCLRFALIGAAIGAWPHWVRVAAKRGAWPQERLDFMQGLRWRAACWVSLFELLLAQGGYRNLVRLISG
jgi:hypothetical protein